MHNENASFKTHFARLPAICVFFLLKTFYLQSTGLNNAIIIVPADKSNIDILCHKSLNRQHG